MSAPIEKVGSREFKPVAQHQLEVQRHITAASEEIYKLIQDLNKESHGDFVWTLVAAKRIQRLLFGQAQNMHHTHSQNELAEVHKLNNENLSKCNQRKMRYLLGGGAVAGLIGVCIQTYAVCSGDKGLADACKNLGIKLTKDHVMKIGESTSVLGQGLTVFGNFAQSRNQAERDYTAQVLGIRNSHREKTANAGSQAQNQAHQITQSIEQDTQRYASVASQILGTSAA